MNWELLVKRKEFRNVSTKMNDVWDEQDDIGTASINAFKILYGGKVGDDLNKMRLVILYS
jgi:hypothetical protein